MLCRFVLFILVCAATGCARTVIEPTRYEGQEAYRLTDGRFEAIVVPAWRRVMHYAPVGEANVLWTGSGDAPGPWINRGGEKAWLWPQEQWRDDGRRDDWPPPNDLASSPGYEVIASGDGVLRVGGVAMPGEPLRIVREYRLGRGGELIIDTRLELSGASSPRAPWAIWSIVQLPRPQRIEAELLRSAGPPRTMAGALAVDTRSRDKSVIDLSTEQSGKIGLDAHRLQAVYPRRTVRFMRAVRGTTAGRLPPGEGAQVYVATRQPGIPGSSYVELELISVAMAPGTPPPSLRVVLSIE